MSDVSGHRASSLTTAHNYARFVDAKITQDNSEGLNVKAVISNYTRNFISTCVRNYEEKTSRHAFAPEFFPTERIFNDLEYGLIT